MKIEKGIIFGRLSILIEYYLRVLLNNNKVKVGHVISLLLLYNHVNGHRFSYGGQTICFIYLADTYIELFNMM